MDSLPNDSLSDFEQRRVTLLGKQKSVFVLGDGPPIIVMHEAFGLTPEVARFCRWISAAGFSVYAPSLFGSPGKQAKPADAFKGILTACVSREFYLFRDNQTSPIVQWLRALAEMAHQERKGAKVGVIGMCLTGNFALGMAVDPWIGAPVMAEPSLPLFHPKGLQTSPSDIECVKRRAATENLRLRGYRFEGDTKCPPERFETLAQTFGAAFEAVVLPDSVANADAPKPPHSVFTMHLVDRPGEPTRENVNGLIDFFTHALSA